jgi:signal transduction histidine kinase
VDLLRGPWLWALTALVTAAFYASAWSDGELAADRWWLDGTLILINTVPLLLLGRHPLVVVLVFAVTYPLWLEPIGAGIVRQGHVLQSVPTLVALYATGAWGRPLWLRAIALLSPAWMMAAALVGFWDTDTDELSFVALVLVIIWALGVVVAGRRDYIHELEVRTRELEAARQDLAERAVADERSRIARELHDVVAHAMSVITVQAGVGGHLLSSRPERAGEALGVIERISREALEELRRMLVVLRPLDAGTARCAPQPGVADLPALAEGVRTAGVRVELEMRGTARSLPPGLDLTVYRVVQECLTNVTKHAVGATANVSLQFGHDQLVVEVRDHGGGAPDKWVPGHGLVGMAERVQLYDGSLVTSTGPEGFRVTATFPIAPRPVAA